MNTIETTNPTFKIDSKPEAYLQASEMVDFEHPTIQALVAGFDPGRSQIDNARDSFHFVRDQISHSWDIQSRRITAKASDVLQHKEGICYAKSHLLAAILRAHGLPAGICYQRLTLYDDPADGHCIHALNAVYLEDIGRWVRMDSRGNRSGIDSQFSIDHEQLAFHIRPEYGEIDYGVIHALPHPLAVAALLTNDDCLEMCSRRLPTDLDLL